MRRLATSLALVTAALTASVGAAAPAMAAGTTAQGPGNPLQTSYYLALGDSLSVGIQPIGPGGADETTTAGYTYQLYNALHKQQPGLRMVDLGCSGETTGTMINGGLCDYPPGHDGLQTGTTGLPVSNPVGSQLQAATAFLRAHRGHVSLITIDIGANDLNPCIFVSPTPTPTQVATCIEGLIPTIAQNLTKIMTALRAAGGNQVRIIGMRYYDPELAYWLAGDQPLARASVSLVSAYNNLLAGVYEQAGAKVADVFTAFHTADFTDQVMPGIGTVPENVATICELTWECTPVHNEHLNAKGYAVAAQAFLAADRA